MMTKKSCYILIFEQIFMGHSINIENDFAIAIIFQRKPSWFKFVYGLNEKYLFS